MSGIKDLLVKDTDKFNCKTILLPQLQEWISRDKIFVKMEKLAEFMPADFIDFLRIFAKYPDPFIKFPHYYEYHIRRYEIILGHKYYELFYRKYTENFESVRLSIYYYVAGNYCLCKNGNICETGKFGDLFAKFFTYNY